MCILCSRGGHLVLTTDKYNICFFLFEKFTLSLSSVCKCNAFILKTIRPSSGYGLSAAVRLDAASFGDVDPPALPVGSSARSGREAEHVVPERSTHTANRHRLASNSPHTLLLLNPICQASAES